MIDDVPQTVVVDSIDKAFIKTYKMLCEKIF